MINARITAPSDKSISHRALILAAIADGKSEVRNCSESNDVKATLNMLRTLGISIKKNGKNSYLIYGKGLKNFNDNKSKSKIYLNAYNSGTSARLILGLLAGTGIKAKILGDKSLSKRPMNRVKFPLQLMGANIIGKNTLPVILVYGVDKGINFIPDRSSAQVKSAILIAGLFLNQKTQISEKVKTRDHTEILLKKMGADIKISDNTITLIGSRELRPIKINIVGDFSSAMYLVALGSISQNAKIIVDKVGLNPTRTAFLDVIRNMGCQTEISSICQDYEPGGSIEVISSKLKSVKIDEITVSKMIDEIPILSIMAACADGVSHIRGASELRKKESDRISALVAGFKKLRFSIREYKDGFSIKGKPAFEIVKYAHEFRNIDDYGDHRIAMAFNILELATTGNISRIYKSVKISYPEFYIDIIAVYLQTKIKKSIVITGFMGSGKTTVGKNIAKKLKMNFFDLDYEIEKKEKMSVQKIFEEKGEAYFRKTEREHLSELIGNAPCVIATGGGTLLNKFNQSLIDSKALLFILNTEFQLIRSRLLKERKRPLLKSESLEEKEIKVKKFYNERKKLYDNLDGIKIISNSSEEATEKMAFELFNSIKNAYEMQIYK